MEVGAYDMATLESAFSMDFSILLYSNHSAKTCRSCLPISVDLHPDTGEQTDDCFCDAPSVSV